MELVDKSALDTEIEKRVKKLNEKFKEAKRLYQTANADQRYVLESLFPELKESEDERIRKGLIENFKWFCGDYPETSKWGKDDDLLVKDIIAWLEKQGDKPKKVSIWKHWKDGIAGGAGDEQVFLQKIGRNYCISSCLGCECDYIELSELDKLMREEKQGKPKWSEEDDYNVQCCIAKAKKDITNGYPGRNKELIEWLESLKQRMEE